MNEKTKNDTISIKDSAPIADTAPSMVESTWFSLMPMVLIFLVLYFLVLRPQEKRQKEHAEMTKTVKKGEKVLLSSGIIGMVVKASEDSDYVYVQISDNSIITIVKSAISDVLSRKDNIKLPDLFVANLESEKKKPKVKKLKEE
jgi:preprotein translocase subunit YajC